MKVNCEMVIRKPITIIVIVFGLFVIAACVMLAGTERLGKPPLSKLQIRIQVKGTGSAKAIANATSETALHTFSSFNSNLVEGDIKLRSSGNEYLYVFVDCGNLNRQETDALADDIVAAVSQLGKQADASAVEVSRSEVFR